MTIIIIIIGVAVLALMASKMLSKGPPKKGRSGKSGKASGSDEVSSAPTNAEAEATVKKALKMSSDMEVKGVNLFHPPAEPKLFTGRKEILKKIIGQITSPPILIGISGFSGIGKTTLALSLSQKYSTQYKGGYLQMDMHGDRPNPPSAADLMRRIILKFHPTQVLPTDEKKLSALYRVALKKQKGIMILENAANTKQVKPLIPPSSWLLIVTSVKPVSLPKMVNLVLESMEVLESHTLLTRWAPDISPAIKEISQICKGVPLALEIIGKLFAINSTMAPEYFAKKLTEARSTYGEDEKGNLIDGLKSAISLCYHMLPGKTALILRKLLVFPGSFTANATTFICEDPKSLSLTGLEKYGLVQLNTNTGRFSLHPQIKSFIKPLFKSKERALVEKRLATEYMNMLETANLYVQKGGKDAIKGFRLFDLELDNIHAGMEWSQKHSATDKDAARLCNAYAEVGGKMVSQRLSPSECVLWLEAALSAAAQLDDKESGRKILLDLGQHYALMKDSKNAITNLEQALSLCKQEGDSAGQKTALKILLQVYMRDENFPTATKYLEESLNQAENSGDKEEEFKLLAQLTEICTVTKEFNKAAHTGEQAMSLTSFNEDKVLLISLIFNLGKSYTEIKEEKKAIEQLEKGIELSKKTPKAPLQGKLIKQISEAAFKAGDAANALKYLVNGIETVRKAKDLNTEGTLLIQLAEMHIKNQTGEQAEKYLEEAQSVYQKTKDRSMEGEVLWVWSQAYGNTGNLAGAVSKGLEAQKIYEALKKPEASEIKAQVEKWSNG